MFPLTYLRFNQGDEDRQADLYSCYSLFCNPKGKEKTPITSLTIGCMLGGSLLLSAYSLAIVVLLTVSVTPWMILFAAPYFFLGAGLGYEAAQPLQSPIPNIQKLRR